MVSGAGVLPSGGGDSRLVVVPGAPPAYCSRAPPGGYARHSSARRAVSRLNQSCRERLIDAIALFINYLDAPLGSSFTELLTV